MWAVTDEEVALTPREVGQLFDGRGKSRTGRFVGYQRSPRLLELLRRRGVVLPLPEGIVYCRARAELLKAHARAFLSGGRGG